MFLRKRFLLHLFIVYVCISIVAVPLFGQLHFNVYADQQPAPGDNWTQVPPNDQYLAFLAYMRARDLSLSSSAAGALTSFTSDMYQNLVSTVGLDMNSIQAGLFGIYDNNQWLRFGFSALGINAFNRLCAQFLQDYNISVDDENVNKTIKTGEWFTDADGNGCYVTQAVNMPGSSLQNSNASSVYSYLGTPYYFSQSFLNTYTSFNATAHLTSSLSCTLKNEVQGVSQYLYVNSYSERAFVKLSSGSLSRYGFYTVFRTPSRPNKLFLGIYWHGLPNDSSPYYTLIMELEITNGSSDNAPINVTSPKVKGPIEEPPGDDILPIEPDGTIVEPEPDPPEPGGTTPDWTLPDTQITPIDPDDPSGGSNVDWNFQLPDLNIDWSINGLSEKFPFCIPSDVVQLVTVLDQEPQAPEFSGTIDLLIYQWELELEFSQFNSIAVIFRNVVFILFCIGLALATRSIIRG